MRLEWSANPKRLISGLGLVLCRHYYSLSTQTRDLVVFNLFLFLCFLWRLIVLQVCLSDSGSQMWQAIYKSSSGLQDIFHVGFPLTHSLIRLLVWLWDYDLAINTAVAVNSQFVTLQSMKPSVWELALLRAKLRLTGRWLCSVLCWMLQRKKLVSASTLTSKVSVSRTQRRNAASG